MSQQKNLLSQKFVFHYEKIIEQCFSRNPRFWPIFGNSDISEVVQARNNRKKHHGELVEDSHTKKLLNHFKHKTNLHLSGEKLWGVGNKLLKGAAIYSKNWENPSAVENVVSLPSDPAIYGSLLGILANANLVHREYSGMTVDLENHVIEIMAKLAGYNPKAATGIFTQGGTFCNLYGYLFGIRKSLPEAKHFGMGYIHDYRIINSQGGHYSNTINLSLLGVNIKEKTIRIKVSETNDMDVKDFEFQLESCFRLKCIVPSIMLTMGTTDTFGVDRVKPIYDIRNRLCEKYDIKIKPHIHVDSAVGWNMLFFLDYNFTKNPLGINQATLEGLKKLRLKFKELKYADSFTVDFQKWGYVPYTSSLVMVKNRNDLRAMENDPDNFGYFDRETQGHTHLQSTIECSRSAVGVYGAFASLYYLGSRGYQTIIAHCLQNANYFRSKLGRLKHVKVLSSENQGPSVGFRIYNPKYVSSANLEFHYEYIKKDTKEYRNRLRRNTNYHHGIFKKRGKKALFTNWVESIAHSSYDSKNQFLGIPGEKAVFLNPKTTRKEIDAFLKLLVS